MSYVIIPKCIAKGKLHHRMLKILAMYEPKNEPLWTKLEKIDEEIVVTFEM